MRMEQVGVMVHNKFESFDWKMYFPSTWLEFVLLCPDLMVFKQPGSYKRFVGIKDNEDQSLNDLKSKGRSSSPAAFGSSIVAA